MSPPGAAATARAGLVALTLALSGCPFVPVPGDTAVPSPERRIDELGVALEGVAGFGASVASGRDLDGDGVLDLVVGSPDELSAFPPWSGVVRFYSGRDLLSATPTVGGSIQAAASSASLGGTLTYTGDLNLDGADDLVIGETNARPTVAAYVYSGWDGLTDHTTEDASARLSMGGLADSPRMAVADPGDWTDDGVSDLVVAIPNDGSAPSGRLFFVQGPMVGPRDLRSVASGELRGQGGAPGTDGLVRIGDTNGDGLVDLVAGAPQALGPSGAPAGAVWIVDHPWTGLVRVEDTLSAITAGDHLGWQVGYSVCPAGDANDDGYADLWVGVVANDQDEDAPSRALLIPGPFRPGTTIDHAVAALLFDGEAYFTLAGGEDLDGDEHPDVVLGWPDAGDEGDGAVWVYTGPSIGGHLLAETAWPLVGVEGGRGLGSAAFIVPDLDDDGLHDPLVQARGGELWILPTRRLFHDPREGQAGLP